MNQEQMIEQWDEINAKNTWFTSIAGAFEGLTAEQAAWKPSPNRHSIWQILHHICFWREVVAKRAAGGETPPEADVSRFNFEEPPHRVATDAAWQQSRQRLAQSHQLIRDALAGGTLTHEKFKFVIPHDAYHVGQVMYLRAMQGLKPVE